MTQSNPSWKPTDLLLRSRSAGLAAGPVREAPALAHALPTAVPVAVEDPVLPETGSGEDPPAETAWSLGFVVLLLAAHVPIALAMNASPWVSTAHAMVTLLTGLWYAASGRHPDRLVFMVAYIAGVEVIWRMTGAMVFWEFGKYATVAVLLVAFVRNGLLKSPALPMLYFLLLLPSAVLTVQAIDLASARSQLSFNLSGPLALAVLAWFFAMARFTPAGLASVLLALVAPCVGIATLTLFATVQAGPIAFGEQSNLITSGGFGPNQVSTALGLGALACFCLLLDPVTGRVSKIGLFGLLIVFAAQSALTFSRGGLYCAGGGALAIMIVLFKDQRARIQVIPILALGFAVVNFFLLPYLQVLTDGALLVRFQDTDLTGRDDLVRADIEIWKENPVLGVGPGLARTSRGTYMYQHAIGPIPAALRQRQVGAHTEFSRMLAEHGSFGIASIVCLALALYQAHRRGGNSRSRAWILGLTVWSFLFLMSNGMRTVAPSFALALGFAQVRSDEDDG